MRLGRRRKKGWSAFVVKLADGREVELSSVWTGQALENGVLRGRDEDGVEYIWPPGAWVELRMKPGR